LAIFSSASAFWRSSSLLVSKRHPLQFVAHPQAAVQRGLGGGANGGGLGGRVALGRRQRLGPSGPMPRLRLSQFGLYSGCGGGRRRGRRRPP